MKNLVQITEEEFDIKLDVAYATSNNFVGKKVYEKPLCFLHEDLIGSLNKAIKLAKNQGLRLKIFDCYRPFSVQKYFYEQLGEKYPGLVSNPDGGRVPHCRGLAIDLTLIDEKGRELDMGCGFDDVTDLAFHACQKISADAQKNRYLLLGIMVSAGFDFLLREWWHYNGFDLNRYPILDVKI